MRAPSSPTVGTTSTTSVDPVPEIADAAAAAGAWLHVDAAYAGSARVCPEFRTPGLRARRLARRQPAQVAVHAGRLLVPLHGAPRRPARGLRAHAGVPAHVGRGRHQPQRVRARARPALPRAQAVGRPALLRPRRAAGDDPRARAARGAVRGLGARRAGLGVVRSAPLLGRLLPAGAATTRAARRCSRRSTRAARPTSRTRGSTTGTSCASRSATAGRPRTTCARPGTSCSARPARLGAARGRRLMRVLVLQHIACEPPGVFEDVLVERGHELVRVELDEGEPLPGGPWDAIVAMGGPMSVNDEAEQPLAGRREGRDRESRARGQAVLGLVPGRAAAGRGARRARLRRARDPEVGVLAVELTEDGEADPVLGALPPASTRCSGTATRSTCPRAACCWRRRPPIRTRPSASGRSPTPCSSTSR